MRLLCIICSKKERTHIGVNGGEHITICDSQNCWDKFLKRREGAYIKTLENIRVTK